MKKTKGFTLVELLVAITILAIVAVLGWRGLDSIVRARVALTRDLEQTRGIQLAFAQMQSDCAQIVDPADLGGHLTLFTDAARLTMIRAVYTENQPSRMQIVSYRLRDGQLKRFESVATRDAKELDTLWQAAINEDSGQGILLQSDVDAMVVQTWDSTAMNWRNAAAPQAPGANVETPAASGTPATTNPVATVSTAPTGLQIALQLRGSENSLTKIFLLGAS
jgi:general secretion pathway protein J